MGGELRGDEEVVDLEGPALGAAQEQGRADDAAPAAQWGEDRALPVRQGERAAVADQFGQCAAAGGGVGEHRAHAPQHLGEIAARPDLAQFGRGQSRLGGREGARVLLRRGAVGPVQPQDQRAGGPLVADRQRLAQTDEDPVREAGQDGPAQARHDLVQIHGTADPPRRGAHEPQPVRVLPHRSGGGSRGRGRRRVRDRRCPAHAERGMSRQLAEHLPVLRTEDVPFGTPQEQGGAHRAVGSDQRDEENPVPPRHPGVRPQQLAQGRIQITGVPAQRLTGVQDLRQDTGRRHRDGDRRRPAQHSAEPVLRAGMPQRTGVVRPAVHRGRGRAGGLGGDGGPAQPGPAQPQLRLRGRRVRGARRGVEIHDEGVRDGRHRRPAELLQYLRRMLGARDATDRVGEKALGVGPHRPHPPRGPGFCPAARGSSRGSRTARAPCAGKPAPSGPLTRRWSAPTLA